LKDLNILDKERLIYHQIKHYKDLHKACWQYFIH